MLGYPVWFRKKSSKKEPRENRMFMRRLREDMRGATTAVVAAALIPMIGVIGCGVDMSRAYLAKTRLQQACDAGVLGGRKVMTGATVDSIVTAEVQKFVNYDFPQGTLDTAGFAIAPTAGANSSVDLTLSTTMPTVIMRVFGTMNVPISASCTARQDFVNTDIVPPSRTSPTDRHASIRRRWCHARAAAGCPRCHHRVPKNRLSFRPRVRGAGPSISRRRGIAVFI